MAPKKQITGVIKLQIPAGQANPAPPIGPALGQKGANIKDFCDKFNAQTRDGAYKMGTPLPVLITVYQDRSFTFEIKTPPASHLIKEAAGIKQGNGSVGRSPEVGKISMDQVRKIAEMKMVDFNCFDINSAMRMIIGSARSMGVKCE